MTSFNKQLIKAFSFHEQLLKFYEENISLFRNESANNKSFNPALKYQSKKTSNKIVILFPAVQKNLSSNAQEINENKKEYNFHFMKICDFANLKVSKPLIQEIKDKIAKLKFSQESQLKLFFDGGCSGVDSIVIYEKLLFN